MLVASFSYFDPERSFAGIGRTRDVGKRHKETSELNWPQTYLLLIMGGAAAHGQEVLAYCCSERDSLEFKELNPGRAGKAFPTIMFTKTIQESL